MNSKATYKGKKTLIIGDQVRTYVKPKNMKKQNVSVWSKDVLKIMFIKDNQYQIMDVRRRVWNRHELLKVDAAEGKDG